MTAEDVGDAWAGDRHGPFDAQWADGFHDAFKRALTGGSLDELRLAFSGFGDSWHDAVVYAESHDEVGNTDDRIAKRGRDGKGWEMAQLAAAGTVLARGIPMLFMGQEGGESPAVRSGRRPREPPRPPPPGGTIDCRWAPMRADPGRSKVLEWYRRMLADPPGRSQPTGRR